MALMFNKCPKMHENECNLAGNTITFEFLRRYSLYQIYTVDFYDDKRLKLVAKGESWGVL